ncbi:MAG: nucleotidyltransferase domain-containing protein [Clostridiales bacterium]|nr:nucleotidyltransferase domain-containing protein [Clostridiales bacterium]
MLDIEGLKNDVAQCVSLLFSGKLDKIILYGSYARGDYDGESDIDFMVLARCAREELRGYEKKLYSISNRLSLEYDVMISFILQTSEFFDSWRGVLPLYRNIIKDGIEVRGYERREGVV